MTNQPSYPLQSLTPEATDDEKRKALEETVQQLVQEGMTPEQAQQTAMQMLQEMMSQFGPIPQKNSTDYSRIEQNFMRARDGMRGNSNGMPVQQAMNDRYTNFNPGFLPDGRVSNK